MTGSARKIDPVEDVIASTSAGRGSDEGDTVAFASYLESLRTTTVEPQQISTVDLIGAVVASLAVLGSVISPWIRYVSLRLTVEYVPGYKTDGVFLIATSLVAIGAMLIAWRRGPGHGDIEALTALVASALGVITTVITALYLNGYSIADASGREEVRAAWGIYVAGAASVASAVFAFRAMRSVQV